jgi:hypothetical protein
MTCPAAGGPATCSAVLTGNTAEEMLADGMKHVTEAHPEIVEQMQNMSKEEMDKFIADFHSKFDALPESTA